MRKIFDPDSAFVQVVTKVGTILWINLLWLLCCVPVVTIGASTTALYRMMFNLREDKGCDARRFFAAFRSNFKKATAIWLIQAVCAAVLVLLYLAIRGMGDSMFQTVLIVPFLTCGLLFLVVFLYAYPLTSYFENTVGNTLHNGIAMGLHHVGRTAPAIVLSLLPVSIFLSFTGFFLLIPAVWIFLVPGLLAYGITCLLNGVFVRYITE